MKILQGYIILLLFFLSANSLANENLVSRIYKYFPSNLSKISLDKTTKEELFRVLGSPPKNNKKENYFYELSGRKYDTTIGIKDNRVSFIFHEFPLGKFFLRDIKKYISKEDLKKTYQSKLNPAVSHSAGRSVDILLDDINLKITVRNNKSESIESIYIWSHRID